MISGIEIDMYKETSGLEMDTASIIPERWYKNGQRKK